MVTRSESYQISRSVGECNMRTFKTSFVDIIRALERNALEFLRFPILLQKSMKCRDFLFQKFDTIIYYSTITPFYHIWSRERAKYDGHTLWRFRTEQIRTERQFFNERNCAENLACHRLSLVISFIQSNKGHFVGFLCCLHRSQAP